MSLINFYSNIWIYYYNNEINKNAFIDNINKFKVEYNIKNIINIDNEFKFWDINEKIFNDLISTQVILDKQNKCLLQIKKICKLLNNYIINNKQILIITYSKFQILIVLFSYFLNKYANIKLENTFKTINSKIKLDSDFKLNSNLKKILLLNCN